MSRKLIKNIDYGLVDGLFKALNV